MKSFSDRPASRVRRAAVAGQFYPGEAGLLRHTVEALLEAVDVPAGPVPKALIVPHAGYPYSGPVAASAYARLRDCRDRYTRVVLLGPCHYVGISGLAFSAADSFRTPLGEVPLERPSESVTRMPGCRFYDATHGPEHSLEVQLPFLQVALASFRLLPVVVGEARPDAVADVLERLWGGPETLVVVSTDLSHFLDNERARAKDRATCDAIEHLAVARIGGGDACGCHALNGLLTVARRRKLEIRTLDLRNSGDTAGSHGRVVGYGAWLLAEPGEAPSGRTAQCH